MSGRPPVAGPEERWPEERGPEERGPEERGPEERGPEERGPEENPYASPRATRLRFGSPRSSRPPLLMLVALAGYGLFTWGLLRSGGGPDYAAGVLFMAGVAVLATGVVGGWRSRGFACGASWTLLGLQAAITLVMLLQGVGDPSLVLAVNGGIALGALLMALYYSRRGGG